MGECTYQVRFVVAIFSADLERARDEDGAFRCDASFNAQFLKSDPMSSNG